MSAPGLTESDVTVPELGKPVRVLVADDQPQLRGGFRVLVDTAPDMMAVAEAGTGTEAVEITRRERPDVVLMNVRMPELDGIEATRRICAQPGLAATRILVLTRFDLDECVYDALCAGASGFLLKNIPPDEVLTAIRVVAAGTSLVAPVMTRRLIGRFVARPRPTRGPGRTLAALAPREATVLGLVARGLSDAEIAEHTGFGPATVRAHTAHLQTRLRVRDRVQLVIAGYELGLVTP